MDFYFYHCSQKDWQLKKTCHLIFSDLTAILVFAYMIIANNLQPQNDMG
jgi:hypothetical protein